MLMFTELMEPKFGGGGGLLTTAIHLLFLVPSFANANTPTAKYLLDELIQHFHECVPMT